MIKIREEQIAVFNKEQERQFIKKLTGHFDDTFPEQASTLSEQEKSSLLQSNIKRARGFGFMSEIEICLFLDLNVLLDRNFEDVENEMKTRILADSSLSPYEKILRLHAELL